MVPACGNGVVEGAEQCDGSAFGGATCITEGFLGGTLGCASGCTLDTSKCYAVRFVDNGNGTVTDNQTRLQWEKKTGTIGTFNAADPHDVNSLYDWYTALRNDNLQNYFLGQLNRNASSSGNLLSVAGFLGHTDWRLPTITELRTIFDVGAAGCGTGSACIDPVFGPTQPEFYWSSTEALGVGNDYAWAVDFGGTPHPVDPWTWVYYTPAHRVRAVRSVQ